MSAARFTLISGAILMFLAVLLGAFGAHALEPVLEKNNRVAVFDTASRYHFYHALGLLVIGLLIQHDFELPHMKLIVSTMLCGVLIFSGSLYVLALTNLGWLGMVTPIGGGLLLLAWACFSFDLLRTRIQ
ncbi:MAG: DUF423 domain-containing protein [Pseudomonadota bacterium]